MKLLARQLLLPISIGVPKNCVRCGDDFSDYTLNGGAKVCPPCRKPKNKNPYSVVNLLGKPLTKRETQIANMISEAKQNKEIAWECKIAEGSVKVYSTTMFAKAGVTNRTAFAIWWLKKNNKLVA